jgi:hypothetical protein
MDEITDMPTTPTTPQALSPAELRDIMHVMSPLTLNSPNHRERLRPILQPSHNPRLSTLQFAGAALIHEPSGGTIEQMMNDVPLPSNYSPLTHTIRGAPLLQFWELQTFDNMVYRTFIFQTLIDAGYIITYENGEADLQNAWQEYASNWVECFRLHERQFNNSF